MNEGLDSDLRIQFIGQLCCCNSWFISDVHVLTSLLKWLQSTHPTSVQAFKCQWSYWLWWGALTNQILGVSTGLCGSLWGVSTSLCRWFSVQGGLMPMGSLYPGCGLHPGEHLTNPRGSLSREVSAWGVSIQGGLHPVGLHPGRTLQEVSVQGVFVRETPIAVMSGRYASYWNTCLVYLCLLFVFHTSIHWNFIVFP